MKIYSKILEIALKIFAKVSTQFLKSSVVLQNLSTISVKLLKEIQKHSILFQIRRTAQD